MIGSVSADCISIRKASRAARLRALKIGFPLAVRGINKDEKREIIKVAVNAVEEWMLDHPNNRSEVVLFGNRYDIDESKDLLSDYM